MKDLHRTAFTIQFVWKPTPASERLDADPQLTAAEGEKIQIPANPDKSLLLMEWNDLFSLVESWNVFSGRFLQPGLLLI